MAAGEPARELRFGISIVPATETLERSRALVRAAEDAGLDLVGIQDHPYQGRFLDTWSLLAPPRPLAPAPPPLRETEDHLLLHRRRNPAAAAARRDGQGSRVARRSQWR